MKIIGLENDYQTLKNGNKDHFELHLRNLINNAYGVEFSSNNIIPKIDPYTANKYKVNPVNEAPRYFCTFVYKVKAIIPGEIAANKTQK